MSTSQDPHDVSLPAVLLLVSEDNFTIALGSTAVTTFDREDLYKGLLYLMAYYCGLHLAYLEWFSTLLSVLQTKILQDSIHD